MKQAIVLMAWTVGYMTTALIETHHESPAACFAIAVGSAIFLCGFLLWIERVK